MHLGISVSILVQCFSLHLWSFMWYWVYSHRRSEWNEIGYLSSLFRRRQPMNPIFYVVVTWQDGFALITVGFHIYSFICWWQTTTDVCSPWLNIRATSLNAVMYKWCQAWATANMLKLNDKTEHMRFTNKSTKHLNNLPTSITIGNAQTPFKQSVKKFGFT